MAMIQCPECGKEISDKAKTCPHCGVAIYVCPECGQVSVGNESVCPHCGYTHAEKKPVLQDTEEQGSKADGAGEGDIVAKWLKENPKEQKWCKPYGLFMNVINLLILAAFVGIILCCYFFIQRPFETIGESENYFDSLELVLNYKVYIRNAWILAVCFCISWGIFGAISLYMGLWVLRCGNWLKTKKIDVKEELKKEPIEFQDGIFSGIRKWDGYQITNAQRAYMYNSALGNRDTSYLFSWIFRQIVSLAGVICLVFLYTVSVCDMIEQNAVLGMHMTVFSETQFFTWLPWLGGILGGMILLLIILMAIKVRREKQIKARFRQVLSK